MPSSIIIDFIAAVTMIEGSISPLTAKSKPKKFLLTITLQLKYEGAKKREK